MISKLYWTTALVLSLGPVGPALAQQATDTGPATATQPATDRAPPSAPQPTGANVSSPVTPSPQPGDQGLGDIVVTALKRETNVQKTPVVIDVVSGAALSKVGVVNITAIQNIAPALNFGQANGVYTTVTIRGVSSQDATELGDPAVAFNVDGEYINRPLNLAASLFDVSRVEVLRGPQGTLYGRNSTAGAVNILTNRPTHDLSASVTGQVGNYGELGVNGFVNVPVTDDLAVRVAAIHDSHNGYTRAQVGPRLDDQNIDGARIRALWNPVSRLSVLLTGEYILSRANGPATTAVSIFGPSGQRPVGIDAQPVSRRTVPGGVNDPYLNTEQKDVRAEINYDFGFARLTDVVGYRTTKVDFFTNIDGTPFFAVDYQYHSKYDTLGNEVRLANGSNSPFTWQVGYYYFDENQGPAYAPLFQNASPYLANRSYAHPRTEFDYGNINARSNAFFGEVTVPVVAGISVTGGVRHTHDEKSRSNSVQQLLDLTTLNASGGTIFRYTQVPLNGSSDDKKWTYNAVLNWQATSRNLLYAKYSTGYKSGGFTTTNTYGPENLTSYEVGTKNRFFNGVLQLNADFFYYQYKDQQVQTFLILNGVSSAATENAASSTEYGVEFDGTWLVTPRDRLRLTADYLHAKFNSFTAALISYGGVNVSADLSGGRLSFAPKWTLSGTYSHDFELSSGAHLVPEILTAYKSSYNLALTGYPANEQSAFTKTDATLTYSPASKKWELEAYVRNIENQRTYRFSDFTSTLGFNFFRWQFADPRTFGLRATVNFR